MMHLVERIAARFHRAGVPLMVLKGAALNLTVYERPDERPMTDLDFMVRIRDVDAAAALLEQLGCLRSEVAFREDFFPKYCYEIEYTAGSVDPVLMDVHVRPFRLLRYARLVSEAAMWHRAVPVAAGAATVLMPAPDDMLIHLALHSAIHGNRRELWLRDMVRWAQTQRIDWGRFLETVSTWRVGLGVRRALEAAERLSGPIVAGRVRRELSAMRPDWRDRLALWHAPRDGRHKLVGFGVHVLTTPGWRFRLGFVRDVLLPDRTYMNEWSARHRCPGFRRALLARCVAPLLRRLPQLGERRGMIEVHKSSIHGLGVFARRQAATGDVIARYRGRPIKREGTYVSCHTDASGRERWHEITGPLRFLNHSCRPNARLSGFKLIALKAVRAGDEITIDYGRGACECRGPDKEGADDGG